MRFTGSIMLVTYLEALIEQKVVVAIGQRTFVDPFTLPELANRFGPSQQRLITPQVFHLIDQFAHMFAYPVLAIITQIEMIKRGKKHTSHSRGACL